jgi:transposase
LFKSPEKWSEKKQQIAKSLFREYYDIAKGYSLTHSRRMIFCKNSIKNAARLSLARWYDQGTESEFKTFNTIAASVYVHYDEILNFFVKRSTNASAESFNSNSKDFRA